MSVMTLSKTKLKQLGCPAGKAKETVWDAGCKGLVLELRKSGGSTWYLRYVNLRGRQRQLRLGDAHVIALDQARKRCAELRGQIALGLDPAESKRLLKQTPTLARFVAERYMPFIQGYKRSWRLDESLLRNHLLPRLGDHHLDQISKHEIITLHQNRRATGAAPASANRLLILMRFIYNLALRWEVPGVVKNPTQGVPLFEENNQRERYLSREEAARLNTAIQNSESRMLRFIVPMLVFTGARKREVLDARWADIDVEKRIWRIAVNKSGKARHVPLSTGVLELLKAVKQQAQITHSVPCEWIFANPESGKPYVQLHRAWDTARKRAGLADLRMHDLRHTFASLLINAGRSLYEVQKILGHTQIKTTQRYSHLSQDTLIAAADTATEALGETFRPGSLADNQPVVAAAAKEPTC